jgi:hypothetical protein
MANNRELSIILGPKLITFRPYLDPLNGHNKLKLPLESTRPALSRIAF